MIIVVGIRDSTGNHLGVFIDEDEIVITCKEDLINTYIENDFGELRDLYIEAMNIFGIKGGYEGSFNYLFDGDRKYIACMTEFYREGQSEWSNHYCDVKGLKQLTLSDLKPRTRTEYIKITDSIFDLRPDFEAGELYFKCSEGDWVQAVHESEVVHFLNNCGLYRKVEKETDWREEVMKYLFENDYHNSRIATDDWLEIKQSFKNDEFLELCRVALRANGEIE